MALRVSTDPYPYLVWDDALDPGVIHQMRRNWPGEGKFLGEIPGNYVCNLRPFLQEGFWREFTHNRLPDLLAHSVAAFAERIDARYPGIDTLHVAAYALMQAQGNYGGHDVHNHHYHDPTWVTTILVYLDADAIGHEGTTMLRTKPGVDVVMAAAQTLNWQGWTEEHSTVGYQQGRLFAFHDNPIAYHCVRPSAPGAIFGRRILRFHITAPVEHCHRLYGVEYQTYQQMRAMPTKDARVLEWMRKDIDQLRSVSLTMSQEERNKWARKIKFAI